MGWDNWRDEEEQTKKDNTELRKEMIKLLANIDKSIKESNQRWTVFKIRDILEKTLNRLDGDIFKAR